ncbi:MAG: hypothetical protein DWQ02_25855 [Bacteroidetes bacterium]|nr:MAG: hypothetical protein DWQ02_25855 [Bacteroidota bacterium]
MRYAIVIKKDYNIINSLKSYKMSIYLDQLSPSMADEVELKVKLDSFEELETVNTKSIYSLLNNLDKGDSSSRKPRRWKIRIVITIERD